MTWAAIGDESHQEHCALDTIDQRFRRNRARLLACLSWSPYTEPLPWPLLQHERVELFNEATQKLPGADWSSLVGLRMMGFGLRRVGFLDPNDCRYIIKIPRNAHGIEDNTFEASVGGGVWEHPSGMDIPTPRTTWAGGRWEPFWGIRCERVKPLFREPRLGVTTEAELEDLDVPAWVYEVDAFQVGYTAGGRLVAYDTGH